jgi:hypothetical protein
MTEAKTRRTGESVPAFLARIDDDRVRRDCATLVRLMRRVTGQAPAMWGPSIVGFGTYHYVYASGNEGDWPLAAFSPRKRNLTIYFMPGFDRDAALLERLGRARTAKSCLYVNSLADVDLAVLERMVADSVARVRRAHPPAASAKARAGGKDKAKAAAGTKARAKRKATRKAAKPGTR